MATLGQFGRFRPFTGRILTKIANLTVLLLALAGCNRRDDDAPRLLILGMDGLDPVVLKELMDAGRLPNFSKLAAAGTFVNLGTSMPPQSPVAWANFISGADPGTHEIYDFIHRRLDPADPRAVIEPYLSTSVVERAQPGWWTFGATELPWFGALREREQDYEYRIPLAGDKSAAMRQGGAFWDNLVKAGIDTTIYRVPANYPPPVIKRGWFDRTQFQCLCGMGTPDLLGGYGTFTFLTTRTEPSARDSMAGRVARLQVRNHRATATIKGPPNFLVAAPPDETAPPLKIDIDVVRDPRRDLVKLTVAGRIVLLKKGEWSPWLAVPLETGIPGSTLLNVAQFPTEVPAAIRVYVKGVHPDLELYVTPLNIDPRDPANAISTPPEFAADIAAACGPYYTTGIPEDTKALHTPGRPVLDEDEFLAQVRELTAERMRQYRHALRQFRRGLLFFYFGHTDQLAHIFWRDRDPGHPGRKPEQGDRYAHVIDDTYVEMDGVLGEALATLRPQDAIIVMSDHGFASFRRGFHVNTWLAQNGYLNVLPSKQTAAVKTLADLDWTRTTAYAIGINSLYLNMQGRERRGIVAAGAERAALLKELAAKLCEVRDADGAVVIERVYITEEVYPQADPRIAPDLLIGYARNYRGSNATAQFDDIPAELLTDNLDRWSGDHCIAHYLVPGVLLSNRKIGATDPTLSDLAPTILSFFGLPAPAEMRGRALIAAPGGVVAAADSTTEAIARVRTQDQD